MSSGNTVMPCGKYKGKTLDEIARTDDGLLYLDCAVCAWAPNLGIVREIAAYLTRDTWRKVLPDAKEEEK